MNKNGFTIIEIIYSVLIISICVLGFCSLLIINLKISAVSDDIETAKLLSSEKLEFLKSIKYNLLPGYNNSIESYNSMINFGRFKREILVSDFSPSDTTLSIVEVNTYWKPQSSGSVSEKKISLSCLIYK